MADLRKSYFPPGSRKVNAHITLFHALPHSRLATIEGDIGTIARRSKPFKMHATKPYVLGTQGVALRVRTGRAEVVYQHLRDQWYKFLSNQDKTFRPHYTVQDKVDKDTAEATFEELRHKFLGSRGVVEGLSLHRYDKGYWRPYGAGSSHNLPCHADQAG